MQNRTRREREVTGVALAKAATRQTYQLRSIPASLFPSLLSTVTADIKSITCGSLENYHVEHCFRVERRLVLVLPLAGRPGLRSHYDFDEIGKIISRGYKINCSKLCWRADIFVQGISRIHKKCQPNLFSISAYIWGEISSLLFPCTSTTMSGLLSR